MATVLTTIGSNSSVYTSYPPVSSTGSGPWEVRGLLSSSTVTGSGGDPVRVGDRALITDNPSSSDYEFIITGISIGSGRTPTLVTLTYVSDTAGNGDTNPVGMLDSGGSQATVLFQRYFSTITLWEAALSGEAGGTGNDAVGECLNDSSFDEGFDINDTTPDSITLRTSSLENGFYTGHGPGGKWQNTYDTGHDGTAGTGVRIVCTGAYTFAVASTVTTTIEKLEIDYNGQEAVGYGFLPSNAYDVKVNRLLLHDLAHNSWIRNFRDVPSVSNTIVYNIDCTAASGAGTFAIETNAGVGGYGNGTRYNCTVWNTTSSNSANPFVYGFSANASAIIKNCISINTGTNADYDFGFHASSTHDYNMSADSTAGGANSITSASDSTQFVSTVNGSEDLHLKAGSDAIGVGADLGTTDDVNMAINFSNRDYYTATTWDMGASQFNITVSIGSDAGRDYSTVTLWEGVGYAAPDYGISGSEYGFANPVGEMYNDSVFSEAVVFNGAPEGTTLTVAPSERHDGTAGTGARFLNNAQNIRINATMGLEWFELDMQGNDVGYMSSAIALTDYLTGYIDPVIHTTVSNLIVHDVGGTKIGIEVGARPVTIQNCIVYDCSSTNISADGDTNGQNIVNCTSHSTSAGSGFEFSDIAETTVRNCISTDSTGNDFSDASPSNAVMSNNLSSDTTASGTGSLTSKTSANQFVSTVGGSEDLHLKAGADALGAGVDLGTTITGVNIDINGLDRDASSSMIWDIGAHQLWGTYTATTSIGTTGRDYSTITLWEAALSGAAGGVGSAAVGECYNDSTFTEAVNISDSGPASILVTVPAAERHDGTEGTGATNIAPSISVAFSVSDNCPTTLEWIECSAPGSNAYNPAINISSGSTLRILQNMLIYDSAGPSYSPTFAILCHYAATLVQNVIIHDCGYGINSLDAHSNFFNVTIVKTTASYGFKYTDYIDVSIKNCIVMDNSSNTEFSPHTYYGDVAASNNMTSDTSAIGTDSLVSKASLDQFVSNVSGSPDLHLKSGADAIGAGTDLGAFAPHFHVPRIPGTAEDINIDINGLDRDAAASIVWDMGAHQYRVTTSIGTTARDYTTITLWEAAIGGTAGGAGNDVVGEMYNDSAFDEGFDIDNNTPDAIKLTVASGEEHDGTAGTGARIVATGDRSIESRNGVGYPTTIERLEIDFNGYADQFLAGGSYPNGTLKNAHRLLVHDMNTPGHTRNFRDVKHVSNTIIYNVKEVGGWYGANVFALEAGEGFSGTATRHNCTVWNTIGSSVNVRGIVATGQYASAPPATVRNCISINPDASVTTDFSFDPAATPEYNMSADSSATGTGSITGVSASTQFVSTVDGSEDLHLKAGSDAIGVATDLGTAEDVNVDINGLDRDASTSIVWDMGAHQYRVTTSIGTTARDYSTATLWEAALSGAAGGAGNHAQGEMYNDSAFGEYLLINDTAPATVTLTVPVAERHDGTAGTGARFLNGTNQQIEPQITMDLEWFELDLQGNNPNSYGAAFNAANMPGVVGTTIANLIVHDVGGGRQGITIGYRPANILNCIAYDIDSNGISVGGQTGQNVFNCTSHLAGTGIYFWDMAGVVVKNCIATDATGDDFSDASPSTAAISNNLSSDTTASGTGSLTSKTSANQYVSTVSGAEDLHLKAGADAIGAATDLGTTPADVNVDINGLDRDASTSIVWDMGAHQYRVTTSIGTTARDYSTVTLWEAALSGTAGGAGNHAQGEMYNDSAFDEDPYLNEAAPNTTTLTVPVAERHDGTAGTGVRFVMSTNNNVNFQVAGLFEWIEIDMQGSSVGCCSEALQGDQTESVKTFANCIIHDTGGGRGNVDLGFRPGNILNCISYDSGGNGYGWRSDPVGVNVLNCVSHNNANYGFSYDDNADNTVTNCISTDNTVGDYKHSAPSNTDMTYNLSSDTTASGTGSLTSKTSANQYVSNVGGSEDLHLKAGADAIGAGTDLGTTDGVNIDINGLDRDAAASIVWDMGAHQYRITTSIGTTARDYSTITLWEAAIGGTAGGTGSDVVGECYNDSVFDEGFALDDTTPDAITLTVASGEEHDGTAGTGARIVATGDYTFKASTGQTNYVEWLEIDLNGSNTEAFNSGSSDRSKINRLIVHDAVIDGWVRQFRYVRSLSDTIVYNTHCTVTWGAGVYGINLSASSQIKNCTVWNTTKASGGGSVGIRSDDRYVSISTTAVQNCISVNTGAGSVDFDFTNTYSSPLTHEYNMSADSSADGANSITGVSASTQFVSTVNGSEDLRLKAGSDAIGVGTDLGTTDDVNLDINGLDRDFSTSIVWDMGAHQYRVTTSIGTAIGESTRDYSTITLWEAAIGGTAGGAENDVVGEMYNDSAFDEGFVISDTTPDSIKLTVASGEEHDGTAGTGVRIVCAGAYTFTTGGSTTTGVTTTIEKLEIDHNGQSYGNPGYYNTGFLSGSKTDKVNRILLHDLAHNAGIQQFQLVMSLSNTIVYDTHSVWPSTHVQALSFTTCYSYNVERHNCTVWNTTGHSSGTSVIGISGYCTTGYSRSVKNCISINTGTNADYDFSSFGPGVGISADYNMSADSTAIGSNSITGVSDSKQFVSTLTGSEDLHLITGSDALRTGVDLGTTNGVNIDIDGRDRDSNDDTWDIGADQCESCATGGAAGRDLTLLGIG